jgi:hypothetical protein
MTPDPSPKVHRRPEGHIYLANVRRWGGALRRRTHHTAQLRRAPSLYLVPVPTAFDTSMKRDARDGDGVGRVLARDEALRKLFFRGAEAVEDGDEHIGAGPPSPSRFLPLALEMSGCLALPEIASAVVQNLSSRSDKATLYALTATNRALCEASLDVLWEEPKVWHLAQLMNSSIWYLETGFEEVENWDDYGHTAHTISREYSVSPHMRPLRRARDSSRA